MAGNKTGINFTDLERKLATSSFEFSCEVFKHMTIRSPPEDDLFLSPFSLSVVLSMTYMGARNNTADQMMKALKIEGLSKSVHDAFQNYLNVLKNPDVKYLLCTASRLFISSRTKLLEDYVQMTKNCFGAETVLADFIGNCDKERITINTWVEKETQMKIKNLIGPGCLNPMAPLILVNAVYFKGTWAHEFRKEFTSKGKFHVTQNEVINVDMMHATDDFNIGRCTDLNCHILELPYIGKDLSMYILLPFEKDGLKYLEEHLTVDRLQKVAGNTSVEQVNVSLPKFSLEARSDLTQILQAMGMVNAFHGEAADFSGIDGTKFLSISDIIHKAVIEVNEQGTVAAAATATDMVDGITMCETFIADHPFLFYILDKRAGVILFFGRLVRPYCE